MEFPIFSTTPAGTPQIAELHDFRLLHPDALAICQAALLEAGVGKFGFPDEENNGFVLQGDGMPSMQALITSIGGAQIMGAAALFNVVVHSLEDGVAHVEGELLVASTPEIVAVVHEGVVGFEANALDPEEAVQTVHVDLVTA